MEISRDIENSIDKSKIISDVLQSKQIIYKNIQKDRDSINKNQELNNNFIVTTGRLTQFYKDNIKGQKLLNNVLKLSFIVVFSVFLFLFKNDLIDIIKGTIADKSIFIKPELPTITSFIVIIIYLVWLFNNKNIREMSYFMIATLFIYVIFIPYLSIKLRNNPLNPGLYGGALIPVILYFIIEKINMDHNIIPIYKKNSKLAFNMGEDVQSILNENESISKIITDYNKSHKELQAS